MSRGLVRIYRTGDDYRRYSWEDPDRRASLTSFFKTFRRYFGRSVLDLGCGGGVLGAVIASSGRSYLGVDANPDMLGEARKLAGLRFLEADIRHDRIPGRFDTLTLIRQLDGAFQRRSDGRTAANAPCQRSRRQHLPARVSGPDRHVLAGLLGSGQSPDPRAGQDRPSGPAGRPHERPARYACAAGFTRLGLRRTPSGRLSSSRR